MGALGAAERSREDAAADGDGACLQMCVRSDAKLQPEKGRLCADGWVGSSGCRVDSEKSPKALLWIIALPHAACL